MQVSKRYIPPTVFAAILVVAIAVMGYRSCNTVNRDYDDKTTAVQTGDVVVTNGEVNEAIATLRDVLGLQSRAAWEDWLAERGVTEEEFRQNRSDFLLRAEALRQAAQSQGVGVTEGEIDNEITLRKAQYLAQTMEGYLDPTTTEEDKEQAWAEGLAQEGLTEDTYRITVEVDMLENRLRSKFREEGRDFDEWFETYRYDQQS